MNSFLAMPKREGESHFTEAWQLPPPQARQEHAGGDTSAEGVGGSEHSTRGGEGAYVGLFRPSGGKKSEMGFHVCVAVIPLRAGDGAGAIPEEYLDQRSRQRHYPEGPLGQEVWNMSVFYPALCFPHGFDRSCSFLAWLGFPVRGVECGVNSCPTMARLPFVNTLTRAISIPFVILCPIDPGMLSSLPFCLRGTACTLHVSS